MTLAELGEVIPLVEVASSTATDSIPAALGLVTKAIKQLQDALRVPNVVAKLSDNLIERRRRVTRVIINVLSARDRKMANGLFANPAWNIMLDAYVSQLEGRQISVTDSCIAAGVPPTTALRWVRTLEEEGLLARTPDPRDRRRAHVTLTPHGLTSIETLIDSFMKGVSAVVS